MASFRQAHLRHAEHYEEVLRAADDLYEQGGAGRLQGLALFDLEQENIEAGQAWAAAYAAEDDAAARLCSNYPEVGAYLLHLRLHAREQIRWLEVAVAEMPGVSDRSREGNHLGNLGNAYRAQGEVNRAIGYHQRALAISQDIGDRRSEGADLGNLGLAYSALGAVDQAVALMSICVAYEREIGTRTLTPNGWPKSARLFSKEGQ